MGCAGSRPAPAPTRGLVVAADTRGLESLSFKVVLIGDKAVGKSSLVLRFVRDAFSESVQTTIGAAFASKDVPVTTRSGNGTAKLQLWDTAGEELYRAMTRSFFRDAAAALVVFDVTSRDSFAHVRGREVTDADVADALATHRAAATAAGSAAEFESCEVSAKANTNVGTLFARLAQALVNRQQHIGEGGGT
jgi:small GTP-binding protein